MSLAFNFEYVNHFFINFQNQSQFQNPHDKQIPKLLLIFEFDEEFVEIFMVKSKAQFPKIQLIFNYGILIHPDGYSLNELFVGGGQIAGW